MDCKWPPDISNLEKAYGYEEFSKTFKYFCQANNFKMEEIWYLMFMMNTFCFLNKPKKIADEEWKLISEEKGIGEYVYRSENYQGAIAIDARPPPIKDYGFVYKEIDENHPKYKLAKEICDGTSSTGRTSE